MIYYMRWINNNIEKKLFQYTFTIPKVWPTTIKRQGNKLILLIMHQHQDSAEHKIWNFAPPTTTCAKILNKEIPTSGIKYVIKDE